MESHLLLQTHQDMSTCATQVADTATDDTLVFGHSAAIRSLNAELPEIARSDIPILLIGESGTGKEVYGRLIHRLSNHRHAPMHKLSCRTLETSELLAYIKEFQNGSAPQHPVRTLFLDGIDEADLTVQKILISLMPDGENETGKKHIRLIASAVRDLDRESDEGRFRRELYFRINGVCVHLPPLRERTDDIPELLRHFLAKYSAELARSISPISDEQMRILQKREWPGNVRELENLARKIVLLGDSQKAIDDLRDKPKLESARRQPSESFPLKVAARAASRQAERDLISQALERTHWNRKRAARDLQISYKSLLYKIKQIGLDRAHKDAGAKEGQ